MVSMGRLNLFEVWFDDELTTVLAVLDHLLLRTLLGSLLRIYV